MVRESTAEAFASTCAECRFFKALDSVSGSCHRYPPTYAGNESPRELHRWRFPMVGSHGWCGEHQPAGPA